MIYRSARSLATFLLIVNGVAALFGGWSLMIDPTGVTLGLPSDWISRLPFPSYFIPGVVLFILIGLISMVAVVATLSRSRGYEKFIVAEGAILTGWIVIQVLMLQTTAMLHFAMAGIGLTVLGLGAILIMNQMRSGFGDNGYSSNRE